MLDGTTCSGTGMQWRGMSKGIKSAAIGRGRTQQLGALERLQDVTVGSDLDGSLHSAIVLPLHVLSKH